MIKVRPVVYLLAAVLVQAQLHGQQPGSGGLRGRIVDTVGAPIEGATVVCRDDGGREVAKAVTDQRGEYTLRVRRTKCVSVSSDVESFEPATRRADEGEVLDISLAVARFGGATNKITGTVHYGKRAIENASVWLTRLGGGQVDGVRSDARGEFVFETEEDGDMVVCVRSPDIELAPACSPVTLSGSNLENVAFNLSARQPGVAPR